MIRNVRVINRGAVLMLCALAILPSFAAAGVVPECTTESYDLDDGIVPEGWQLRIIRGGHFSEGVLWGQPVDGGCWLGKPLEIDGEITSLDFSWDGSLAPSVWGLYTGIYITMKDGGVYTILNVSWTVYGSFNIVRFKEPWDQGWEGSLQYYYPLEDGEFRYELRLEDEYAHFVGRRAGDGSQTFDHAETMLGLFLDDIEKVEFAVYATTGNANWLDNPTLTTCADLYDRDNDGIADFYDSCPDSELLATVVIDGCDSGVPNHLDEHGCSLVDLITVIAATAADHSSFVEGVSDLTNLYKDAGIISGFEKGRIQSCAARAEIP